MNVLMTARGQQQEENIGHMCLYQGLLLAWRRGEGNYHRLPGPPSPQSSELFARLRERWIGMRERLERGRQTERNSGTSRLPDYRVI